MPSFEKVILIFSGCDAQALTEASSPALTKLLRKGALLNNVSSEGDTRAQASTGAQSGGETLWDAAVAKDFVVGDLTEQFDLCVMEGGQTADELESTLAKALEMAGRSTVVTVVGAGAVVFYGPGLAKGKVLDQKFNPTCVAPTVAYVANFPVPAQCEGAVVYAALNDVNLKLKEMNKLKSAIQNMEAAMERKARQPWDKHDCAQIE